MLVGMLESLLSGSSYHTCADSEPADSGFERRLSTERCPHMCMHHFIHVQIRALDKQIHEFVVRIDFVEPYGLCNMNR